MTVACMTVKEAGKIEVCLPVFLDFYAAEQMGLVNKD